MATVSKRDLNQRTAAVLDQVTADGDVVVTERGRPRWRLSAFREDADTADRLRRSGHFTPPSAYPAPWPARPGGRAYTDAEVTEILDEIRGER